MGQTKKLFIIFKRTKTNYGNRSLSVTAASATGHCMAISKTDNLDIQQMAGAGRRSINIKHYYYYYYYVRSYGDVRPGCMLL
jgi:hypothetical protein